MSDLLVVQKKFPRSSESGHCRHSAGIAPLGAAPATDGTPDGQSETDSFADLMRQLSAGSEAAALEIVEVYGPCILRVVRRALPREIRSKVDSIDLVNTLLGSLLVKRHRLSHFREPAQLIAFLTSAARNRVIDEHRKYTACAARSIRAEEGTYAEPSFSQSMRGVAGDGASGGREQTPSQVAIAREKWQNLIATLNRRDRRIIALRISGKTYDEIAESVVDVSARTARRVVAQVTEQLMR
ncbi:MAG: sigma-70 family RNA polymerase sigma factor [Planctomycetota bacterium]